MLNLSFLSSRSAEAAARSVALFVACLSVGCPGVEPSTGEGFGGKGGDGGAPPNIGGQDHGGGGTTTTGPSGGAESVGGSGGGGCDADLTSDLDNCGECGRKCLDEGAVKMARCIDGLCESFCKSGFVNITKPASGRDDGCESPGRRVFVTEDVMTAAEVESVSTADTLCQALADEAKLGGAWRAWLSEQDGSSSPLERFTVDPDAPYMLLDFTPVAGSWAALIAGDEVMLDHPIDLTEAIAPASNQTTLVWTGTDAGGQPSGNNCSIWTAAKTSATVGKITEITAEWTEAESPSLCDAIARLYCFEQ